VNFKILKSIAKRTLPNLDLRLRGKGGAQFPLQVYTDTSGFDELATFGCYDQLLDKLPPPQHFLDIGCNSGFFSLVLYDRARARGEKAKPWQRGLLVDADAQCVQRAQYSMEINRLTEFVSVIQGAVGPRGQKVLFHKSKSSRNSSTMHRYYPDKTLEMDSMNLENEMDSYFGKGFKIDLLKVDIEGGEIHLLNEWASTLQRCKALLAEQHSFAISWKDFVDRMDQIGFFLECADEGPERSTGLFKRKQD